MLAREREGKAAVVGDVSERRGRIVRRRDGVCMMAFCFGGSLRLQVDWIAVSTKG